jgi:putative transposase
MLHSHFYEVPPYLAGETIEVHFDPRDLSQVEIYFQGQSQGSARAVDHVVNAQLPGNKAEASPTPKPTGVNFIELLQKQNAHKAKKE